MDVEAEVDGQNEQKIFGMRYENMKIALERTWWTPARGTDASDGLLYLNALCSGVAEGICRLPCSQGDEKQPHCQMSELFLYCPHTQREQ